MPKNAQNYHTIALISHAIKVRLKILQARLQQYVNHELPDVQAGFKKAEEPEIKLPTSTGSSKMRESSKKKHLFQSFPQFIVIHTVKGFEIVNKAKIDFFSGTLLVNVSDRMWSTGGGNGKPLQYSCLRTP